MVKKTLSVIPRIKYGAGSAKVGHHVGYPTVAGIQYQYSFCLDSRRSLSRTPIRGGNDNSLKLINIFTGQ